MAKEEDAPDTTQPLLEIPEAPPWEPKPTSPPRKKLPLPIHRPPIEAAVAELPLPEQPLAMESQPEPSPAQVIEPPAQTAHTMSSNNEQKLRQAILHLTRYFHLADAEQIEGRNFFGEILVAVKWRNGQAEMISGAMDGTDRGVRHGR